MSETDTLETLRPTKSQRIMDLVEEAGHDTADWAKFKGGLSKAASNSKYCYEWVYCQQSYPLF